MSNTSFQELNLSNQFLFPAALEDPVTCRLVLECIVEEKIGELAVKVEYTRQYNSEFKCIRLDVFAKDVETEVSYNTEMQNNNEYNLPLRSRYYQAQLDVGGLKPGEDYMNLKPLYVIFICNFDPFKEKFYKYTFSMQCEEKCFPLNDGVKRIFLNTKGDNKEDVPGMLIDFLGYLNDSTDSYVEQNSNEKVKEIHERIKILKKNRDVEKRYMHYLYVDELIKEKEDALRAKEAALKEAESALKEKDSELKEKDSKLKEKDSELKEKDSELKEKDLELKEARNTAREAEDMIKEMIFDAVNKLGKSSEEVRECIRNEKKINILKSMYQAAINAECLEQFEKQMVNL